MVLTEAFASSTPVVASDIAGYRDVVRDGIDGLLVPAAEPAALGEALRSLALDPERRERMADGGARARGALRLAARDRRGVRGLRRRDRDARARRAGRAEGARSGSRPASRVPPRRLPSIEPGTRPHGGARPCGWPPGGDRRRRASAASASRRSRSSTSASSRSAARVVAATPVLGARGVRAHVRLDAHPRRGLARDPARRPARHPRAPPRHRAGDHDRRADVGHAAGPAGRALACVDPVAAAWDACATACRWCSARWSRRPC